MNLRWHSFERAGRRAIKAEIAKSATLKKLRRKAPRRQLRWLWLILSLYFWLIIPLALGRNAAERLGSGALVFALASVLAIAFITLGWLTHLDRVAEPAWHAFPFARENVFGERARSYIKSLLYFTPIIFGGSVGLYFRGEIASVPMALAHGFVQAGIVFVCALHLAAYFQQRRGLIGWIAVLFSVALIVGYFVPSATGVLREASREIMATLPSGWVHHVIAGASWREWIYILPIALLLVAVPQSVRRVRSEFMHRPVWTTDIEDNSGVASDEYHAGDDVEIDPPIALARSRAAVREGLLETAIHRIWNEEQRHTAAFLWPAWQGWTSAWFWTAKFMLLCLLIGAIGKVIFNYDLIVGGAVIIGGLGSLHCLRARRDCVRTARLARSRRFMLDFPSATTRFTQRCA